MKSPVNSSSPSLPTLLLITDFAKSSEDALYWAIPEAQTHNWRISVLYPYRLDQARIREHAVKSKKDLELEAAKNFESQLEGPLRSSQLAYEFHSEVGFTRDRIMEATRRSNIVLVVVGQNIAASESIHEILEEIGVPAVIVPTRKS